MSPNEIAAQALALKRTAETLINAKVVGAVDDSVRKGVEELVRNAKSAFGGNAVIANLQVSRGLTWPEALMIANAVYAAAS